MSRQNTTVAKLLSDGTIVLVLPDGSTKPLEDQTDWARLRAMTAEEAMAAAVSDPDAQPMTPAQRTARRVPRARTLRRALALTQEEFAARYLPLGTLRDWEQGRCEPDQPARAYLAAIAHDPESVKRALSGQHS
jgi:putative transcriptional regulator